jgi:signal transduction histidine kinase
MNIDENAAQTIKQDRGKNYSLAIAERLIKAIEEDDLIASSCSLSSRALRDHLPEICQTVVETVISTDSDIKKDNPLPAIDRVGQGIKHGYVRSTQNFKIEELVREFSLLKQVAIEELTPHLLTYSSEQVIEKLSSVDKAIDRIVENSFQSYATARKRQLDDLRQQVFLTKQELTRLIAAHQESLSYLVHEIKNPLTSIIGYSDLFIRQQQQEDTIGNLSHIQQVLQQGRKVLRLVNDTSEISAFKQGNFQIRSKEVDICALLENITLCLKASVEAKQLELVTSCQPERLIIYSDSLRIQQIITNLLINAVRYTEVGKIELSCHLIETEELEIRVIDTGIGISKTEQEHIFEPYFRGQQSQDNAPEGIGLGLAIVAQLVAGLNGKIELNSELGRGSIFIVTIPLDR